MRWSQPYRAKMTKSCLVSLVPPVSSVWNTSFSLSFKTQLKCYLLRKILLDYPILTSHHVPLLHWPICCNSNSHIKFFYCSIYIPLCDCVCFISVRNRILSSLNGFHSQNKYTWVIYLCETLFYVKGYNRARHSRALVSWHLPF